MMTQADESVVEAARRALATTVARLAAPDAVLPLIAVAVAGLFADFVSASPGAPQLIAVVNGQLKQAGWEIVRVKRN